MVQWVLSSKQINFPYPVALTLLHMLFSSVLCFLLTKVFKVIKIEGGIYSEIALCLFVPWIFLEKPKMDSSGPWNFPPIILGLNCLCTFALNLSVFLVISRTSALTIRVAGVVRDWVVVLLSALIFSDSKLTIINLIGYGIVSKGLVIGFVAISGIVAYNNHKLKNEASEIKSVVDVDADDQGKSQDDQAALIPPLKENT
ncbi:UAA transporter family [Musa troglodytarum]|uniref:UAA transporter family n=1 Tax=Musa troglodytarum TaxID=320322 RepID=A0A9E7KW08_9LILI|nr:UAA transporter family [Musa troglodytarum]